MLVEAFYHRAKGSWAFPDGSGAVLVRMRTKRDDADAVTIVFGDKYDWYRTERRASMEKRITDERFDYWEALVRPPFGRLSYRFELQSGEERHWYAERWDAPQPGEGEFGNFEYPYVGNADLYEPPSWVKDAVFYQIFPDRFANGDATNDPEEVEAWGGKPTRENYFGGDLQGVIDKLDYLETLGVNAIYFNPLFQAKSYHKYDTTNYFEVDRHFGSKETLRQLVEACHRRGIRVLLDAVFNHAGEHFPPFRDAIDNGASSPYADWFLVREWPMQAKADGSTTYETFGFEPHMPKFNTANPKVRDYLLEVARYWIRETDIDGFRLDVANEVDHAFWRKFREAVKSLKPDAYILGEIMHDATPWLQGDQLDAVMNYAVTDFAMKFFVKDVFHAAQFANCIGNQLAMYPSKVSEIAFNLLDSHDTPRLLTLCHNDKDRMKLAVIFQFTYPGTPCIYYGDEVGLTGGGDPDNRQCMEWDPDKQDLDLLAFYRQATRLRRSSRALRDGGFRFLQAESGARTLVYERSNEEERIIVLLNASAEARTIELPQLDGSWRDAWHEEAAAGDKSDGWFLLPPYGFRIFKQAGVHDASVSMERKKPVGVI
ncbi:alpha-glycosidase [Paenibacillus xanthanilyticus]|uniref:Alpha-glycosidase n=1 Tax=Paenibacillus xanthanilyticus TaxID=1783531 RepID=A0ABV8JUX4_9BACL